LDAGRKVTFHARYLVQSPAVQSGQTVEQEIWRRPPDVREDTRVSGGNAEATTSSTFFTPDGVTSCSRAGAGAWTCEPAPDGKESGPDALLSQLATQLAGVTVASRTAVIAGVASRCYDLKIAAEAATICLRSDGVPTLRTTSTTRVELLTLDDSVTDADFEPPAS
jgi:hypothetical protein